MYVLCCCITCKASTLDLLSAMLELSSKATAIWNSRFFGFTRLNQILSFLKWLAM